MWCVYLVASVTLSMSEKVSPIFIFVSPVTTICRKNKLSCKWNKNVAREHE